MKRSFVIIISLLLTFYLATTFPVMAYNASVQELFDLLGVGSRHSLIEQVEEAERVLFGKVFYDEDASMRLERLRTTLLGGNGQVSLLTQVMTLEWSLLGQIQPKSRSLLQRIVLLEYTVFRHTVKGSLSHRVNMLWKSIFQNEPVDLERVKIEKEHKILVKVLRNVHSDYDEVGRTIPFEVNEDLLVDGVLVIPKGSRGELIVRDVKASEYGGKSGFVSFDVVPIETIALEQLPLAFPMRLEGHDQTGIAFGMSLVGGLFLGPAGFLSGFLVSGEGTSLTYGDVVHVQIEEDVEVWGVRISN